MTLVYNIIDQGYCDPEYPFFVAGFFWPQMNDDYADRNIIHIDSYDWANRVGPDVALPFDYQGTIAHEYEHAIHYDHDADEPSWVDEGMADLSGFLAGYGHSQSHLAYYLVYHRTPLTVWGNALEDYNASSALLRLQRRTISQGPLCLVLVLTPDTNAVQSSARPPARQPLVLGQPVCRLDYPQNKCTMVQSRQETHTQVN